MKKLLSIALFACLVGSNGCNKGDDATPDTCSQISARTEALTKAATTYSTTVNKANCEAYRTAANNYLDAAAKCPAVTAADIARARDSISSLNCQ